ncbi:nuclear transport factor 2 family protein [Streptomyces sp. NPDC046859]|uniref:nuclear transport factor 2 family protein n=1 Tax=Streptomyces sp. NPDC046859 TaxID=3155734 RepID=UPI0033CCA961
MTQRVELATLRDRLALDELVTEYAVAVDDGDWEAYRGLFAPGGQADYRSAGGVEGDAGTVAAWLAESMRAFSVRQHLIVNRRVRFGVLDQDVGDTAEVRADYVNPMRLAAAGGEDAGGEDAEGEGAGAPDFVSGGRYAFRLVRTDDGWRLLGVVIEEKWRRRPGRTAPAGTG